MHLSTHSSPAGGRWTVCLQSSSDLSKHQEEVAVVAVDKLQPLGSWARKDESFQLVPKPQEWACPPMAEALDLISVASLARRG